MKKELSDSVKKIRGKHLKMVKEYLNKTNNELIKELEYSDVHTLSAIYSGIQVLPEYKIDYLVKTYNIRKDYLLGIDEYMTDEDFKKFAPESETNSFKVTLKYLELLGLNFESYIYSKIRLLILFRNWDFLKDYLTESTINEIEEKYNFSHSTYNDIYKNYFETYIDVAFKETPDELPFEISNSGKTLDNIGKNETYYDIYKVTSENSSIHTDTFYSVGYKVYYKNQLLCGLSITELQDFMKKIDSFNKCAIETLLPPTKQNNSFFKSIGDL